MIIFHKSICKSFEQTTAVKLGHRQYFMGVDSTTNVGEWFGMIVRFVDPASPKLYYQKPILKSYNKSLTERN